MMKIIVPLLLLVSTGFRFGKSAGNHSDVFINNKYESSINDSNVLESLEKIKTTSVSHQKKNLPYSTIVIQNSHGNHVDDGVILNDLNKFGAYSKLVSQLMKTIVNKDLGLAEMQLRMDKSPIRISTVNYENIINDISDKMTKKIDDIHSAIEMTGERIQEIYRKHLISNITANNYLGCCDFYNLKSSNDFKLNEFMEVFNHNSEYDSKLLNEIKFKEQEIKNANYHFDKRFNVWTNEQYSCDVGTDDNSSYKPNFFNPSGPNLTEQFRMNLAQNPNIKWQYFMSFLGIHAEYPSYLPPNNYCFLHNLVSKYSSNNNKSSTNEYDGEKNIFSNGFFKRYSKMKNNNKKHDWFNHHRKAYAELNQLFSQRHRENLFTAALPRNKLVMIVLDRGSALTEHQLTIAKSVAKYILNSLSHKDKVGIIDLSSQVYFPGSETCFSNLELAYANYETKHFYGRYIEEMERSHNLTNHHLGFQKAFEVIANNYFLFKDESGSEPEVFIPYISRGLLTSLSDAKDVMQLISDELNRQPYSFVINTYALIDETKPIMYETTFLREVAAMNFKKFNVPVPANNDKYKSGLMIALNSTENIKSTLNGIYTVLSKSGYEESYRSNLYISLPHYDFISKETHISISKAYHYRDQLIGVVGIDLSFFDIAEDIFHYDYPDSYAFLMDAHSGRLLYHPALAHNSRNSFKSKLKFNAYLNYDYGFQNSFVNVEHIEQIKGFFPVVKSLMMTKRSGIHSIKLNHDHGSKHKNDSEFDWWNYRKHMLDRFNTVVYRWNRISSSPYIVVIVSYNHAEQQEIPANEGISLLKHLVFNRQDHQFKFVSHRLDYRTKKSHLKLCKHFNQLATLETATLYLSPNAFDDRYNFEIDGDSYETVQRYMAYLSDRTHTVENPGLRKNVRTDVHMLNFLVDFWKKNFDISDTSKYIVRKYIATVSGTFLLYPGALLEQSFYPKNRPWFSRAVANPGKMIFMPPYLDVGGSGYIVTISQAIYEPNANGIHTENDNVWAVMGIDLTFGYFHKIIDEMVPICARDRASCFLMDDYGYLIVHSTFLRPALIPFIERQHITHREPHVMNDLLNHKNFVQKRTCNSFVDRSIQRYYTFNTSLNGIVTNIVQNENSSCAKYSVVSLEDTNAFFGIVNHNCDNLTTFCPCSLTDRLCLNCHRMEPTDCECPCECPLVMNLCSGQLIEKEDNNPICISWSDRLKGPIVPKPLFDSLDSCIDSECSSRQTESDCKGVLGCEWCSKENGRSMFCTSQNLCFGGMFGLKNPYMTNFHYHRHDNFKTFQNAPVGPLTITLIICFVILTFAVYCFHFQSNRSNFANRYLNPSHNDHQILQPPNDVPDVHDNDYHGENMEAVASYAQSSINSNMADVASPYQYNSNYRRRNETGSDYGYSTMTPNDDSELNRPIYINPEIIRSNKIPRSHSGRYSTGSVITTTNDEVSSFVSSSSLSAVGTNRRLPPPPSTAKSKHRGPKKKTADDPIAEAKSKNQLPVVEEPQPLLPVI